MAMSELWIRVLEILAGLDFWIGVVQILFGLFSFAGLIALIERHRTTRRLREHVSWYIDKVEFEWKNQTVEFILMHRIRAFELLLRRVQAMNPRTPGAYVRVEAVRDALEWHYRSGILIKGGMHLPLPEIGKFPYPPSPITEAQVRRDILEKLRMIKWLRIDVKPQSEIELFLNYMNVKKRIG